MATTTEENSHASMALASVATQIEGMDVRTLATVLVKSGYFKDTNELSQATVKVLAGRELGFGPIASMQGVYIVNGKVTLASNLIAAAIIRSRRYRYRVARLDKTGCTIKFYERSNERWEEIGESSFGPEDAGQAGLKTDTYSKFPRNMYFARALTNGARWYTPDVFNGPIYTPDELGAEVDDDGEVIQPPAAPPMDTAEQKQHAAKYVEIFGDDGTSERVKALLIENAKLLQTAKDVGALGLRRFNAQASWTVEAIESANEELQERIRSRNADLDEQMAGQVELPA